MANIEWRVGIDGGGFQQVITAQPTYAVVGGDVAGFHRTIEVGANQNCTWRLANRGITKQDHNHVTSIASRGDLVLAQTGRTNGGILHSSDQGQHWDLSTGLVCSGYGGTEGPGMFRNTGKTICIDASDDNVWATGWDPVSKQWHTVRSTNLGQSFAAFAAGLNGLEARAIVQHPVTPTTLFLGVQEPNGGIYQVTAAKSATPVVTRLTGTGVTAGLNFIRDLFIRKEGNTVWLYIVGGVKPSQAGGVLDAIRVWKMNISTGGDPIDITGTLAKSYNGNSCLYTSITGTPNGTDLFVGGWAGEVLGPNQAVPVARSLNSGSTWQKSFVHGATLTMPDGRPWWKTVSDKSFAIYGGSYDCNQLCIVGTMLYIAGRAGVWRVPNALGATPIPEPAMIGLSVSMGHGTVYNPNNPDQQFEGNTDWGAVSTGSVWTDVVKFSKVVDTGYSQWWSTRGALVGGGTRSDRTPHEGKIGLRNPVDGNWTEERSWQAEFPKVTIKGELLSMAPRVIAIADGVNASGQRIIIAVAQGRDEDKNAAHEPPPGTAGIYRKVGGAAWVQVSSAAFPGWGTNNTFGTRPFWPEGSSRVYLYDRSARKLWRSLDYGATWVNIWTELNGSSATWSGFMAGVTASKLFIATATKLYRFDDVDSGATVTPIVVNLPAQCSRPGALAWDPLTDTLVITQRVGKTDPGMWRSGSGILANASPTWTEIGGEYFASAGHFPMNLTIDSAGRFLFDGWGNATLIGEPSAGGP